MYEKTIAALARLEGGVWGVVDALVDEVAVEDGERVKRGTFPAISAGAAEAGIFNPTNGEPYDPKWLSRLHSLGRWVISAPEGDYRQFPVKRVITAREKAKGDHAAALAILDTGKTLHEISGSTPLGKAESISEEVAVETVRRIAEAQPDAVAKAMEHETVAAAAVTTPKARLRVRAADARQTAANREAANAEDKARRKDRPRQSQEIIDGKGIMRLGGALGRVRGAAEAAAAAWKEIAPLMSEEGRTLAVDDIAITQQRVEAIFDAMRGTDIDAALTRILTEAERG